MPVCPLDYRYGRKETKELFSEQHRLNIMVLTEGILAEAHEIYGNIPQGAGKKIREVSEQGISAKRVSEIEKEINHDVMALVKAFTEKLGPELGRYVHLGATSSDILDTATAVQFRQGISIIREGLEKMQNLFCDMADKNRNTVMIGRTHGQFAVPLTFGLKMAVFADEVYRHLKRLSEIEERVCAGKLLGAVGTGAALGKNALEIQEYVMQNLGLSVPTAVTQVIQRDIYSEVLFILANIATSLEKFATEIRNLQRSELSEVTEQFDEKKQVGSSTMPHKRNPILGENICGLARIVRSLLMPQMESAVLWHERDLTNSSAERFIIPHAFILCDDIIHKTLKLFGSLKINSNRMMDNLNSAGGYVMAESVMITLVSSRGMGRQEAHELVRNASMKGYAENLDFRTALEAFDIKGEDIDNALMPSNYVGVSDKIIDAVLKSRFDNNL